MYEMTLVFLAIIQNMMIIAKSLSQQYEKHVPASLSGIRVGK
jgi:hypothetical protein